MLVCCVVSGSGNPTSSQWTPWAMEMRNKETAALSYTTLGETTIIYWSSFLESRKCVYCWCVFVVSAAVVVVFAAVWL